MEVYGEAFIGGTIRGDKKEEYLSSGGKVTQIIAKTYECHEIAQPEDKMDVWDTYKKNYKGKKDAKARMEGYATPDTTLKDRNVIKQKLGQGYSYSISIIDSKDTIQRLKNFNDNMKHIRISGENGAGIPIPPKTISEVEEMAEFKEMKNLEELIEYMHRLTANKNKEYYLYALSVVGLDGTGFSGRITYESDNGEEKIIDEYGVLYLGDLFKKY
ncbi:hypothetical protein [Lachnoanaerobaculum sp.]|uniref:hypothetical protein n=1 Tax=Lachnoanaerobaculum sp. TaxID=2049030 RepID=UPI0025C60E47|nr:hypothetical protein [Lachnoanaerobaculum sp.]